VAQEGGADVETHAAADRLELAVIRGLLLADVTGPLERAAALSALRRRLDRLIDREIAVAIETGETYAALARRLGCSRQAVRQRVSRRGAEQHPARAEADVQLQAATAADGGGSTVRGASP
jgi:DNA-binding CsgD family transcriptional regulator